MSYLYLSIDFGKSYVGFSVSNGSIPRSLPVFKYKKGDYEKLKKHIFFLIDENNTSFLIIGVPSNEKSFLEIEQIFLSIIFKDSFLRKRIFWVNEDYSTIEAIRLKNRKRMREDSISASIILDRFLQKKDIYMSSTNITKKIKISDYSFLKERVDKLEKTKEEIVEKRKLVDGDISENADWIVLTQELENINREIEKIRNALFNVDVINDKEISKDYIDIGSKVVYEIIGINFTKETFEVEIVHEIATDPFLGKISCKSPLGSCLMSRKVNEIIEIKNLNYKVRILEIK